MVEAQMSSLHVHFFDVRMYIVSFLVQLTTRLIRAHTPSKNMSGKTFSPLGLIARPGLPFFVRFVVENMILGVNYCFFEGL